MIALNNRYAPASKRTTNNATMPGDPIEVLKFRYASGEISQEGLEEKINVMHQISKKCRTILDLPATSDYRLCSG